MAAKTPIQHSNYRVTTLIGAQAEAILKALSEHGCYEWMDKSQDGQAIVEFWVDE